MCGENTYPTILPWITGSLRSSSARRSRTRPTCPSGWACGASRRPCPPRGWSPGSVISVSETSRRRPPPTWSTTLSSRWWLKDGKGRPSGTPTSTMPSSTPCSKGRTKVTAWQARCTSSFLPGWRRFTAGSKTSSGVPGRSRRVWAPSWP